MTAKRSERGDLHASADPVVLLDGAPLANYALIQWIWRTLENTYVRLGVLSRLEICESAFNPVAIVD
jgi:hypothetical protein